MLLPSFLLATTVVGWRACDVTSKLFGAVGDGIVKDTEAIRAALLECEEVLLPFNHTFLTGTQPTLAPSYT